MDPLLELLEENPRADVSELAQQLDRDEDEIRDQIQAWEDDGTIVGYRTVLNLEQLPEEEAPVRGLIEVNVSPQPDTGFEAIAHDIAGHPEVRDCFLCSGDFDLLVSVRADDLNQVSEFVSRELAPNPHVQGTVSHFRLKTYKDQGLTVDGSGPDRRLSISF